MATPIYRRFFNYAHLALVKDASTYKEYKKNWSEKFGDVIVYPTYGLPAKIGRISTNPQFVALIFTVGALTANSLLFYPSKTYQVFGRAADHIRRIVGPYARISSYALVSSQIIGLGILRTMLGRFANKTLMDHMEALHNPEDE